MATKHKNYLHQRQLVLSRIAERSRSNSVDSTHLRIPRGDRGVTPNATVLPGDRTIGRDATCTGSSTRSTSTNQVTSVSHATKKPPTRADMRNLQARLTQLNRNMASLSHSRSNSSCSKSAPLETKYSVKQLPSDSYSDISTRVSAHTSKQHHQEIAPSSPTPVPRIQTPLSHSPVELRALREEYDQWRGMILDKRQRLLELQANLATTRKECKQLEIQEHAELVEQQKRQLSLKNKLSDRELAFAKGLRKQQNGPNTPDLPVSSYKWVSRISEQQANGVKTSKSTICTYLRQAESSVCTLRESVEAEKSCMEAERTRHEETCLKYQNTIRDLEIYVGNLKTDIKKKKKKKKGLNRIF